LLVGPLLLVACSSDERRRIKKIEQLQHHPGESADAAAAGSGYGVRTPRQAIQLGKNDGTGKLGPSPTVNAPAKGGHEGNAAPQAQPRDAR
jgi:hypothetical protein